MKDTFIRFFVVLAILGGVIKLHAKEGRVLTILVEDNVLNDWELSPKSHATNEPFWYLIASTLNSLDDASKVTLAEPVRLDVNQNSLAVKLKPFPGITALNYSNGLLLSARFHGLFGSLRYLKGLKDERMLSTGERPQNGMKIVSDHELTLHWDRMLEPKDRVLKFARTMPSFYLAPENFNKDGQWADKKMFRSFGPWIIASQAQGGFDLKPNEHFKDELAFSKIEIRKLKDAEVKEEKPTLIVAYNSFPVREFVSMKARFAPKEVFVSIISTAAAFADMRARSEIFGALARATTRVNMRGSFLPREESWIAPPAAANWPAGKFLKGKNLRWLIEGYWGPEETSYLNEIVAFVGKDLGAKIEVIKHDEINGTQLSRLAPDVAIFRRDWFPGIGNHVLFRFLCDPKEKIFFIDTKKKCNSADQFLWATDLQKAGLEEKVIFPLVRQFPAVFGTKHFKVKLKEWRSPDNLLRLTLKTSVTD